jgi:hypothetical protein
MKAALSSLLLTATAVANAANCDVSTLSKIAMTDDALSCKSASNFEVPVASAANTILTNLESFCANDACLRVLAALNDIDECSIEDTGLHQHVVDPIGAVCSSTRALRAADGSHAHSSGMDMGSASAETEDSHEATSASTASSSETEDSHDTASASTGVEDSHDVAYSTSASASAGEEEEHDSHDAASSTASSSATTVGSTASSGTSTGSKATSGNSTSSSQAAAASSTSSAASISIAAGSVFLATAAAFF